MKKKSKTRRRRRLFNKFNSISRIRRKKTRRKYSYKPIRKKKKDRVVINGLSITKLTTAERGHLNKQICYNCHKEFATKEITDEHIPAKNLFAGYDIKYKVNRITVPACSICNGKYSPTDEEFRNMIGIIAKRKENQEITKKTVRSILRKKSWRENVLLNNIGKVTGVSFNQVPIETFHKKNFKGLFYHQYGTVLPKNYEIYVNIEECDWSHSNVLSGILDYLKTSFTRKFSGHEDILSYIIQPFRIQITNPSKEDLIPLKNENIYVGYLEYNKEHAALVIAVRKEYIETISKFRIKDK